MALLILLGLDAPASFGTWNGAGTCQLPAATDLTYQACAAAGQGALNLTKAAFTYTNASCNYPSALEPSLVPFRLPFKLSAVALPSLFHRSGISAALDPGRILYGRDHQCAPRL